MELTIPELSPMFILSEGEVYFLKVILPFLLLLPWAIAGTLLMLRALLRWLASLKPKQKPVSNPIDLKNVPPENVSREERAPKLKDIEDLAKTNPRLAIIKLSEFIRIVNLSKGFEKYSLEYFIKDSHKKILESWTNILSVKFKENLKSPQDLFAEIVSASYQKEEPTTEIALHFIQRVRALKTKSKDKKV